jgi:TRAP-type C4-dicarboxylate transport system permease small subunit
MCILANSEQTLYEKLDHGVVSVIRWISYVSGVFLAAIMLIAVFNVIGEKLQKIIPWIHGISMASAYIQYFHIPVVFLAAGFVTLDRGHTNIDLLSCHFPSVLQKAFVTLGHALGAGVSFFIAYRAFFFLMVRFYKNSSLISTSVNAWPKWPFAFIHGLGFTLLGFSFLWAIVRQYKGPQKAECMDSLHAAGLEGDKSK